MKNSTLITNIRPLDIFTGALVLLLTLSFSHLLTAQSVGVNTTTPAAALDVRSNNAAQPILKAASSGGTERLTILENGSVGIGTTSPTARVDVASVNAVAPSIVTRGGNDYATATGENINFGHWGPTFFERMTITTEGNVGIGTASPTSTLEVSGDVEISGSRLHVNTSGNVGIGTASPTSKLEVEGEVEVSGSRLHVNTSGNVGIGTSSPENRLHVVHPSINVDLAQFETTGSIGFGQIFVKSGSVLTNMGSNMNILPGSTFGFIGTNSPHSFIIRTQAFNRITIDPVGDVTVAQDFSVNGSKNFLIDHPLDPENKKLYHSCIEAPERMTQYSGNATLDANGEAEVVLPDYFEALNRNFRYQLTPIGAPAPNLFIKKKVENNRFAVAGGAPGMEVTWLVIAERNDAFARWKPYVTEEEKTAEERGRYYCPQAFGQPEAMRVGHGDAGN